MTYNMIGFTSSAAHSTPYPGQGVTCYFKQPRVQRRIELVRFVSQWSLARSWTASNKRQLRVWGREIKFLIGKSQLRKQFRRFLAKALGIDQRLYFQSFRPLPWSQAKWGTWIPCTGPRGQNCHLLKPVSVTQWARMGLKTWLGGGPLVTLE